MTLADRQRLTPWLLCLLAALFWHALLFSVRIPFSTDTRPARVEVHTVDQAKVDAIRRQWKRAEREKALLLNPDASKPVDSEAPKDARYMSDRNRIVEKEQRARNTDVLPKPGAPGAPESAQQAERRAERRTEPKYKTRLKDLSALGVPLRLAQKAPESPRDSAEPVFSRSGSSRSGQAGAEQAILDRDLPQGSENLLNTEQSVYYSFYARLYQAIAPIWQSSIRSVPAQRRLPAGNYTTVVDVVFDPEGNLIAVNRIEASGIPELDEAVDSSWQKIGKFPNPPSGLLDQNKQVHTGWTFTVQVGEGAGLQYLPPSRVY